MPERQSIQKAKDGPVTEQRLLQDLLRLGVEPGGVLLVHSSLSAMGWVVGGPVATVRALMQAVGPSGTLVMPTHSSELSNPADWCNPPVDPSWWQTIRDTMPAYDPDWTPSRAMGAICECFRRLPGVLRSSHPHTSFAAFGPLAKKITAGHTLESAFGEQSPLARVYELDGQVLLLGVGHDSNSSLHLAEVRATLPSMETILHGAPVLAEGRRAWVTFRDLDVSSDDFEALGQEYNAIGPVAKGLLGYAESLLFKQRGLVDFAAPWLEEHRG